MPLEEINAYTPQLYRSLGTRVTLDLGTTTADIVTTRDRVADLPKVVSDAIKPSADILGRLRNDVQLDLANAITQLEAAQVAALHAARDELKQHGFKPYVVGRRGRLKPTSFEELSQGRHCDVVLKRKAT